MISEETLAQAEIELAMAEKARSAGFEGRARVSARRAAGIVIRSFLLNRGEPVGPASAYDLLRIIRDRQELNADLRQVIDHLLMRVDEDFHLPAQVDLVGETRRLIDNLHFLDNPHEPGN